MHVHYLACQLTHSRPRCRGPCQTPPFPQNEGKQSRLRDRAHSSYSAPPQPTLARAAGWRGNNAHPPTWRSRPLPSLSLSLPSTGAISSLSRARPSAQLHCTLPALSRPHSFPPSPSPVSPVHLQAGRLFLRRAPLVTCPKSTHRPPTQPQQRISTALQTSGSPRAEFSRTAKHTIQAAPAQTTARYPITEPPQTARFHPRKLRKSFIHDLNFCGPGFFRAFSASFHLFYPPFSPPSPSASPHRLWLQSSPQTDA